MDFVQTDTSKDALVTAIRANLYAFFHHLGKSYPANYFTNEKFTRWHAPIQHPWFSGILSSQLPEEKDETFIEGSIEYFRAKEMGAYTWWVETHLEPSAWGSVLSRHGFVLSNDTPGMAMELQSLNQPVQTVDGLEVRMVAEEESLRAWAHIFTIGYGLPLDWEPAVYDLQKHLGLGYPIRNYLGYLQGEPVSTSTLFCGAGVAGIYSVSTLPKARGKGIGAAITLKPLRDAHHMGYHIGVLQSSNMGFNVYSNLGFKHLCQIEYFYRSLK